MDNSDNVFVTGYSEGTNGGDFATVAYSSGGVPLWTNRYDGPAHSFDGGNAIAVDRAGNVFVTGSSSTGGPTDYATIKYSSAGLPLWTRRYDGGANSVDDARAIAVDSAGNVFVTGTSFPPNGSYHVTVAYSNSGTLLWTRRSSGPSGGAEEATAIAVDRYGNVFVTGISPPGWVTIKYSSSIAPPHLDFQKLNNELVLSWTNANFNLQTAPALTGSFTNIPAATSPFTNALTGPQQVFRLISN